jgi:hypothetical protein
MNSGNYGLSLNQFAFGDEALAWASIFYIAGTMLTNSLGVYVATVGKASPIRALLGLARVPSMYAVPLALVVRGAGIELPYALARPVELLAAAASADPYPGHAAPGGGSQVAFWPAPRIISSPAPPGLDPRTGWVQCQRLAS